jgi:hypothetical protein
MGKLSGKFRSHNDGVALPFPSMVPIRSS